MRVDLIETDLDDCDSLGDVINAWRVKDLDLEPLSSSSGPEIVEILRIPYTYCWSPSLVPKPHDWGHNIGMESLFGESFRMLTGHTRHLRVFPAL